MTSVDQQTVMTICHTLSSPPFFQDCIKIQINLYINKSYGYLNVKSYLNLIQGLLLFLV